MANVNTQIRNYLASTKVPTLAGFIKRHEEICLDYIEQFDTVDDAKKHLTRRYLTLHNNLNKTKAKLDNVRWMKLFEKANTRENLEIAVMQGMRAVVPRVVKQLEGSTQEQQREPNDGYMSNAEDGDEDGGEDGGDYGGDSDNDFESNDDGIDKEIIALWRHYTRESTTIANRKGLSVVNDLQRILSLSHILLIKPRQHDEALSLAFSESRLTQLYKSLRDRYLDKNVKLCDDLFLAMKKIVEHVVEEETTRSVAKRELMKLSVEDNDTAIVDMVYNCISGLPRFMTDANIGEFELITSFLDPILRPLLHDPDQMRLLRWTNRICTEVEGNATKRPDATMTLREHYHGASALGFCEVKPADSAVCLTSSFTDLLRLGLFAKSGIDKEEIRAMMVVQAVGLTVTFYMMEILAPGFYPLVQVATITIPRTLDQLPHFLMTLPTLKRIYMAYRIHCTRLDAESKQKVGKWKTTSLDDNRLGDILDPTNNKDSIPCIRL